MYGISNSLELKGTVRVLYKAVYQAKDIKGLLHHTDREYNIGAMYTYNPLKEKRLILVLV
jgi:putative transposase